MKTRAINVSGKFLFDGADRVNTAARSRTLDGAGGAGASMTTEDTASEEASKMLTPSIRESCREV